MLQKSIVFFLTKMSFAKFTCGNEALLLQYRLRKFSKFLLFIFLIGFLQIVSEFKLKVTFMSN